MLIDTHCHLDFAPFATDAATFQQRSKLAGVGDWVIPAVEVANFAPVRTAARQWGASYALGIHPLWVEQADEADLTTLAEALAQAHSAHDGLVAVGEIGLDAWLPDADLSRQEFFLAEQLKLAQAFELPVLLHIRKSLDRTLRLLRQYPVKGGIAHAFNGSTQQAEQLRGLGFKLGFGGAMTHPKATRLRQLAATLPLEAIVLETDAPDMRPAAEAIGELAIPPFSEPAFIADYARVLADLRSEPYEKIVRTTTANACAVLALQGHCHESRC